MLQSLLPGFRYLRAPLAAGYIWLVALWLACRDGLAARSPLPEVSSRVAEIANWAGKPATLAATALVAYLVGVLSIAVTNGASRVAGLLRVLPFRRLTPSIWLDKRIEASLREIVERDFSEYYADDQKLRDTLKSHLTKCVSEAHRKGHSIVPDIYRLWYTWELEQRALNEEYWRKYQIRVLIDMTEYVDSAKEDIEQLAHRLLGKEEEVYDEYDRRRSEGIFRLALFLPLVALCAVLSYIGGIWWLLGLPVPIAFACLAAASFAEAKRGLASVVSSGRVELPSLERIRTREVRLVPYESLVVDNRPPLPAPYVRS